MARDAEDLKILGSVYSGDQNTIQANVQNNERKFSDFRCFRILGVQYLYIQVVDNTTLCVCVCAH